MRLTRLRRRAASPRALLPHRRWLVLAAAITVAAGITALVLSRRAGGGAGGLGPADHEPLIGPAESRQPEQTILSFLVRRYSEAQGPCDLPPPGHLADWHGRRFLRTEEHDEPTGILEPLRARLGLLGTRLVHARPGREGGPWVALIPEYHGRPESEQRLRAITAALATSLGVERIRVFVEAWNRQVQLPAKPGRPGRYVGIEDPCLYPISRAAWSLLDLTGTAPGPDLRDLEPTLRRVLLDDRKAKRLEVGQHPTREQAEQAIARHAAAWNAMTTGVAGLELATVQLPAAADYLRDGSWTTVTRRVDLQAPTEPTGYLAHGRLHLLAQSMAAVTSRIRTTAYALHVLDSLCAHRDRVAVLQLGANHTEPLVSLLERAGATVMILLTPASAPWVNRTETWRCPSSLLPAPYDSALGYFRLPGRKAERDELELWRYLPPGAGNPP